MRSPTDGSPTGIDTSVRFSSGVIAASPQPAPPRPPVAPLATLFDVIALGAPITPVRVWGPLARSGRVLLHQDVLNMGQAVWDRVRGAATQAEPVAVLRSVPGIDVGTLADGDVVELCG